MAKAIAYFKRTQGRRHTKTLVSFMCVRDDGRIQSINVTEMKSSTTQSFGSQPMELTSATKKDWEKAYTKLKKQFINR